MQPTGDLRGDAVHVGGDARQRFFDSRGYGRPLEGDSIALSRVEAAHLLFRGDLAGVAVSGDGTDGSDPVGFERFFVDSAAAADRFAVRYLVYSDLRDRGFYLSPARDPWPGGDADVPDAVDLVAYERGSTPDTGDSTTRSGWSASASRSRWAGWPVGPSRSSTRRATSRTSASSDPK